MPTFPTLDLARERNADLRREAEQWALVRQAKAQRRAQAPRPAAAPRRRRALLVAWVRPHRAARA